MLEVVLNEHLWFPVALAIALIAVASWVARRRRSNLSGGVVAVGGLNLFYGLVIGIMGFGHLLAVTIKTVLGTLPAATNPWFVFAVGLALAIPAWWLVLNVAGLLRREKPAARKALALSIWLGAVLLALGPSWPLAIPAALNVLALTWTRTPSCLTLRST